MARASAPATARMPAASPVTPAPGDLARLVTAAADGDRRAWEELLTRYRPMVRSVARRFRLRAADVEDVEQQTWAALVRHIGRLREPGAVGMWLATTARHESLRVIDGARRERLTDDGCLEEVCDPADVGGELEAAERSGAVHAALDRIPPRQASLLRALLIEPAPGYKSISTRLDVPVGSIGPTRARGLRRLSQDEQLLRALGREPLAPVPTFA
jgi:RNA polymerase sigma factor (sigma-70 family)